MMTITLPSPGLLLRQIAVASAIGVSAIGLALADTDSASSPLADTTGGGGSTPAILHVYTNSDLEKLPPVPQQKAPLVAPQSWEFVFSVLDRERDLLERRQDRERDREREQAEAQIALSHDCGGCGYGVPGGLGLFPRGRMGPFVVNAPSNPNASLQARGIRTAEDLFNESVQDARIRRQALP